jgi:glutamate decarboxylase
MLSRKIPLAETPEAARDIVPTYASRGLTHPIPRYQLPEESMDAGSAYQIIHDELALDSNPALNVATFVTTYMDREADRLMAETANKNAIDWDEYPQTVEIQDRCVNILSRLFQAPEHQVGVGTATVGSSEAIHLAGLAMKFRWRAARLAAQLPSDRPNLVMGANVQVCWEKFCRYFDVEPRYVPLTTTRFIIGVPEAMALVDENTIGVVGILGSTYTGEYEPIAELDAALGQVCATHGWDVPLHVDAASGGFVAPFVHPELRWDFRLPRVRSINVSGHKYGLVYPGVGWVIWRDTEDLPKELIFEVDYLGGSHANFGLNFSRGAAQIVAQYYNLIRLGRRGYQGIMQALGETAQWIAAQVDTLEGFEVIARGTDLPVVCIRLDDSLPFSVFDLSDRLRMRGWVVPAYRMAADAESVAVLRIVVREGLSRDMADNLVTDIRMATDFLAAHSPEATASQAAEAAHATAGAAEVKMAAADVAAKTHPSAPAPPPAATPAAVATRPTPTVGLASDDSPKTRAVC